MGMPNSAEISALNPDLSPDASVLILLRSIEKSSAALRYESPENINTAVKIDRNDAEKAFIEILLDDKVGVSIY